jgi:Ferritin-like domain
MTRLTLGELDRDGALLEAIERVDGMTRGAVLGRALVGGSALLTAAALPGAAVAAASPARDVAILNYALTLEYVQAAFYTEAERNRALSNRSQQAVRRLGAVERAHVAALRRQLGRKAVARPTFNFRGVTEAERPFLRTAVAFEDLAVEAYKGQAPLIKNKGILAAAVGIHSVEARHAAWMRHLFGILPAARAFDNAASRTKVMRVVAATGFITSQPRTGSRGRPRFTG